VPVRGDTIVPIGDNFFFFRNPNINEKEKILTTNLPKWS
jgi:hypothetical protein